MNTKPLAKLTKNSTAFTGNITWSSSNRVQLPHFFESKFTHAMHLELVLNPKLRIKANSFSQLAGTERIEMPGKKN